MEIHKNGEQCFEVRYLEFNKNQNLPLKYYDRKNEKKRGTDIEYLKKGSMRMLRSLPQNT